MNSFCVRCEDNIYPILRYYGVCEECAQVMSAEERRHIMAFRRAFFAGRLMEGL